MLHLLHYLLRIILYVAQLKALPLPPRTQSFKFIVKSTISE